MHMLNYGYESSHLQEVPQLLLNHLALKTAVTSLTLGTNRQSTLQTRSSRSLINTHMDTQTGSLSLDFVLGDVLLQAMFLRLFTEHHQELELEHQIMFMEVIQDTGFIKDIYRSDIYNRIRISGRN